MENKLMYLCSYFRCGKEFYKPWKVNKLTSNSYEDVCPFCGSTEFKRMESVVENSDENLIKMLIKEDDEITKNIIKVGIINSTELGELDNMSDEQPTIMENKEFKCFNIPETIIKVSLLEWAKAQKR